MEQISLSLSSPRVTLQGLDDGIARLERLEALLGNIARAGRLRVSVKVDGLDHIDGAIANVKALTAALTKAGQTDLAGKLEKGLVTPGEVAKSSAGEVAKLSRELQVATAKSVQMQGKFESLDVAIKGGLMNFNKLDQFASAKKELDQVIAHQESVQKKLSQMQRVQGMAQGISGTPAAPAASSATVTGERNVAAAAGQAAAALEAQSATATKKAKAMSELNAVNEKTVASEKAVATSANNAGNAIARAGEKSRRMIVDEQGNLKRLAVTYAGGPGETVTQMGVDQKGLSTRSIDQVAKLQAELQSVRAEYESRKGALSGAGSARGSSEQIGLLRQEAQARQAILDKMKGAGLEGDKMFRAESIRIRALESSAAHQELLLGNRQKLEGDRKVDSAFRERASTLDRETAAQKALNLTTQQSSDMLRRQAAGYYELSEAMRATGRAGNPTQAAAQRKAEVMSNQATQMDRQSVRERIDSGFKERIAAIDAEFAAKSRLNLSTNDQINLLNRTGFEYEKVARAMRASTRDSGGDLAAIEKKKAVLMAEARSMENAQKFDAHRIASMNSRFQTEFAAFGGVARKTEVSEGPGGRTATTRAQRDNPSGHREMIELTRRWDAAGRELVPTLHSTSTALESTGRSATAAGKSMLDNIGSITAWATAVTILYKSVELLKFGLHSMMKVEFQSARLSSVFRGSNEELTARSATIVSLRDRTLELASANGRGGEEAMDASVRWARLGLTQREVLEAVDVSLKAANVAEISTADSAEQLSAIFAGFRLQVGELRTVLNEVNTVSNNYNVTNKDLFAGLARTGAIAKQAGLGFSELLGIIGSGVGRTGRSGAEIGNAVKSLIVSISNPKIQDFLHQKFDLDVKTPMGDLKEMTTILNEVYVMFQKLDRAGQAEFTQKVGGKMQASRLQAVLDGYVTGQMLAIKAQRDLTSAERENEKIRATTINQLQSLSTAFQRLSSNILLVGGDFSIARQFTAMLELITNIIRLMGNWPGFILLIGAVVTMMGVKIGAAMVNAAKDTGLLGRTVAHLRSLWVAFGEAVMVANAQLARHGALAATSPRGGVVPAVARAGAGAGAAPVVVGAAGAAGATAARTGLMGGLGRLLVGTIAGPGMLAALAATGVIMAAMWGINKAFSAFSTTATNAADKLGIYNKELERTQNLATAAEMSARLAGTLSKAIPDLQKRPRAARQAIEDYAEISYSREEDPKGTRRDAIKEELLGLLAVGKEKQLQLRLAEEEIRFQKQNAMYSGQNLKQRKEVIEVQSRTIALLEKEIAMRRKKGKDTIEQDQSLQEARRALAGLRGEMLRAFTATYDGTEMSYDDQKRDIGGRFKEQFKGMDSVMGAYATTTSDPEAEKVQRKIDLIGQQLQLLDDTKAKTREAGEAGIKTADAEFDSARRQWGGYMRLNSVLDEYQRRVERAAAPRVRAQQYTGGNTAMDPKEISARKDLAEFQRLNAEALAKERDARKAMEDAGDRMKHAHEDSAGRNKAMESEVDSIAETGEGNKKKGSLVEEREKLEIALQYAKVQDAITAGARKAKQETVAFQIGRNDTEQMFSEVRGIGGKDQSGAAQELRQLQFRAGGNVTEQDINELRAKISPQMQEYIAGNKDRYSTVDEFAALPHSKEDRGVRYHKPGAELDTLVKFEPDIEALDALDQAKRWAANNVTQDQLDKAKQNAMDAGNKPGASGLMERAMGKRDEAIASGDKVEQSRAEAEILQLQNRLTEIGVSLEERRYRLAKEIVNERVKEQQEASKNLLLASREEQLRAALVRKFTDSNGGAGFSAEQFGFLDKGTQEAITKFNPESAPSELGGRSKELEQEQENLVRNIGEISDSIRDWGEEIRKNIRLNTNPGDNPGGANQPVAFNAPSIEMQFSSQFKEMIAITNETVKTALEAEIGQMRADFNAFASRFQTGAAQSAGSGTITG